MCLFWPSWILFSIVCTGISFLGYIETATMSLSNISVLFKKSRRNVMTTLFLLTTQDLRHHLWGNIVRFFFHTVSLFSSSAVSHTFKLQSECTKDHTLSTSASVCFIFNCPVLVSSFHHSLKCVCHLKLLNSMFTINILSGVNISQAVLLIFTWNLMLIHCSRFFSLIFHQQYNMNM